MIQDDLVSDQCALLHQPVSRAAEGCCHVIAFLFSGRFLPGVPRFSTPNKNEAPSQLVTVRYNMLTLLSMFYGCAILEVYENRLGNKARVTRTDAARTRTALDLDLACR
jgi:hypothetical protein